MYLKYIQIINYKNIQSAKFEFLQGANTIIGENDSGKSNAVSALRLLLDDTYYHNSKRLKESDFSYALGDWRGHWIIISAMFDDITPTDKETEVCAEIIPDEENADFLKSFIKCEDKDIGVITLFIRPQKSKRKELSEVSDKVAFDVCRNSIMLSDYEFYYTSRAQTNFTDIAVYKRIVGDFDAGLCITPDEDDASVLGSKLNITDIQDHISVVFIDALRDVATELHKPRNPCKQSSKTSRFSPQTIQLFTY